MDVRLLKRTQIIGAIVVCLAYFLPWASIMSAAGSIELRGLYLDYSWLVLVLAASHLAVQLAETNREALALPERWIPYFGVFQRAIPFVILAIFSWYGAYFQLRVHSSRIASPFGVELEPNMRAGLDYGFWLGALGAMILCLSVGLLLKQASRFVAIAFSICVVTTLICFGLSLPGKHVTPNVSSSTSAEEPAKSTPPVGDLPIADVQPELDSSPYVQITSITGKQYAKNFEAERYHDSIVIALGIKNTGQKTIVGLRGHLSVLDGFGKEAYGFNFRDDDKLRPGQESSRGGYNFDANQFDDDTPYGKMTPLITGGTAKYTAKITQIAFEDGTTLPQSK